MRGDPVARALARGLVERLNLRRPAELDIELIANLHGLVVERRVLSQEDGRLLRTGNRGLIAVAERAYASKKWRFVIAHELGHYLRHKRLNQLDMCTDAQLGSSYWESGHEAEANTFAAELLLPSKLVAKRCEISRPNLKHVRSIADEFETSFTMTAIRFVELTSEPCAVVFSRAGVVVRVSWSDDFRLAIARGTRLTDRTYAGDLFADRPVLDQLQQVDGEAWSSSRAAGRLEVFEHSTKLGNDYVLTLLWHEYVG